MPNHVHVVMVPRQEDGLRFAIGECHRRYTRHINFRQGWRGHLWQERFHSFVMDEAYLLATVRLVERNQVAAGLCRHHDQWRWSSARAHLSGSNNLRVNARLILDHVKDWWTYLSDTTGISTIKRHTRTGRSLGSDKFVRQLEALTGKSLTPGKPGRKANKGEIGILSSDLP